MSKRWMPQLSQARTMGGVGAIPVLLGFVPTVGWLLGIAGAVLVLMAIKYVSEVVADPAIFRDMIVAIALAIVGLIVGVVVILAAVFQAIGLGIITPGVVDFLELENPNHMRDLEVEILKIFRARGRGEAALLRLSVGFLSILWKAKRTPIQHLCYTRT